MQRELKQAICLAVGLAAMAALSAAALAQEEPPLAADQEHEKLFEENRFPSATTCATCHPQHYSDWSVSPHAYAQMSPVFNAMHGTVLKLTNGTNGDFCIR